MEKIKTLTVNGNTYEIYDPEAARISDDAIGENAWSSKNIIDRLCPAFTENGSVVACTPVAGYPLEVVSNLPESEEGISAVTLWRGGANLMPVPAVDGYDANGITMQVVAGKIIINGTATSAVNTGKKESMVLPAGTYTISGNPGNANVRLWLRTTGATTSVYTSAYNGNKGTLTLDAPTEVYLYITISAGETLDNLEITPMVNAGDTALPWERYRGESFAADFGITVHGGSYDWTSGVLTDENGNVIQLTAQQIPALSGTNTLHADTGTLTVTGRKDLIALLEALSPKTTQEE